MNVSKGKVVLAITFSMLVATHGYADDAEPVEMDTVVVTGTRTEQEIKKIPANVTVIGPEDIKNSTAQNVVDLLRGEQGIVVRDYTGNGKQVSVDMRGFGESAAANSLVMIDGRRVNAIDLSGVDWTQIPLEQVERIEVVRGTGTVLYGDNAVGGVINIITKLPSDELSMHAGTLFGSYGRNKQHVSLSGMKGAVGGSFYASYDSTNGYRKNSDFRTKDIGGKLVYDPTDFLGFQLSGSYHSDTYGMPGTLLAGSDPESSNRLLDEGQTRDGYINLRMDADLKEWGGIVTDISYRHRTTDAFFDWGAGSTNTVESELDTWGFTPRYTLDAEIGGHANRLVVGTDMYWSDYGTDAESTGPWGSSAAGSVDRSSFGAYVSDEFSLLDNLILSLGARRERVKYDLAKSEITNSGIVYDPLDDSMTETENGFNAGLTYLYSENSSVFIRANRSYRFPLTDELITTDYWGYAINVNADLKPQTGRHYEIGAKHYFTENLRADVTLFRAEIKDEIFYNPLAGNTNHPETLHQGIELGVRADFIDKVTIIGNYTYTDAEFEKAPYDGNNIPSVPEHTAHIGISIHDVIPGFVFSTSYNYVGSSYLINDQANALKKMDDYHTVDCKLSYKIKDIEAFFGINNLTNEDYSEHGVRGNFAPTRNFYPAPGRNWFLGLNYAM